MKFVNLFTTQFPLVVVASSLIHTNPLHASVALYASDANRTINALNTLSLVDGSATLVGDFGVAPIMAGLAYDAVNAILYGTTTETDNLYSIDTSTGDATFIGALGATLMHGLAFDNSTRVLYGTYGNFSQGDGLYTIDTSTGTSTLVGNVGSFAGEGQSITGLAFHPGTNVLYGSVSGPGNILTEGALITIDTSTGAGTLVANTRQITGLAFHPETDVLYGIHNQGIDSLYTLDINTAQATRVGDTGLSNNLGLEFAGYVIPEPSQAVLLFLGLGVVLVGRRRGAPRE